MPPHFKKDTAANRRRSRHRKRLRQAAANNEPHPHVTALWSHVFEGRCIYCMQAEDAEIHNEANIPELLKRGAEEAHGI